MKKEKLLKNLKTAGLIVILTILTFLERNDLSNLDYEKLPGIISGCLIAVIIKVYFHQRESKRLKSDDSQD